MGENDAKIPGSGFVGISNVGYEEYQVPTTRNKKEGIGQSCSVVCRR